ncbi:MAG: FtsQ-type POTRA domain-containing protein [Chloroflexota bacterium]
MKTIPPNQRQQQYQKQARRRVWAKRRRQFESAMPSVALPRVSNPSTNANDIRAIPLEEGSWFVRIAVKLILAWQSFKSKGIQQWVQSISQWWTNWWAPSKLYGLALCLVVGAVAYGLHNQDQWFIYHEDVQFTNLSYLNAEQLYEYSTIEGMNVFWFEPEDLRTQLAQHPYIESVEITTQMPAQVVMTIHEVQPIAYWVTHDGNYWLLDDGAALPQKDPPSDTAEMPVTDVGDQQADQQADAQDDLQGEEKTARFQMNPDLLQIVDMTQAAKLISYEDKNFIDRDILQSALSLAQRLPDLQQIRYNKDLGLNFALPGTSIGVFWGDGQSMDTKLKNMRAAQTLIATGEAQASVIDVRYPSRPYLRD